MTQLHRRLSRRALLRSAALAPVAAAGCQVMAAPTEENLLALCALAPVPEDELARIKAKWASQLPTQAHKVTFEAAARILWRHFSYGTEGMVPEPGLMEYMDIYTTGSKVVQNIKLTTPKKYPVNGNDRDTNYCAYSCGYEAALAASSATPPTTIITRQIYKAAWDQVKKDMECKLAKCRPGGPVPGVGAGC